MKLNITNIDIGEVQRIEIGGKRFYTLDGADPLPSVTTLLSDTPGKKEGLARWRKNTPDWRWINKKALERGNAIHEAIEHWMLTEGDVNIDKAYANLLPPLISCVNSNIDEVYGVETFLHDTTVGAAGTADLICKLKNGMTVIGDYKTSETKKNPKYMRDYFVQTICYAIMYENLTGMKIDGVAIFNVYEKPKPGCNPIAKAVQSESREKVLAFVSEASKKLRSNLNIKLGD